MIQLHFIYNQTIVKSGKDNKTRVVKESNKL